MFLKLNFINTSKANLLTILIKSNSKNRWIMNHAHMRQIRIVNPKFWMIRVLQHPQWMDLTSRYHLGLEVSFSLDLRFERVIKCKAPCVKAGFDSPQGFRVC